MDEKISLEAIALYSDAFAGKLVKKFFGSKERISGAEILSLSDIQQINLFVIRELFRSWREETKKLRSVYFDYDHPEVRDALQSFMTVLSNHISVDQVHFTPLLKKAVSQTLMVVFDPYDFYSMLIAGKNNRLEVEPFRDEIKYLKINKAPLEKMLQRLEEKSIRDLPGNEAFAVLDQILEEVHFAPEDPNDYISRFSAVEPLDPSRFYIARPPAPAPKAEPVNVQPPAQKVIIEEKTVIRESKPSEQTLNERLSAGPRPAVLDNFRKITTIKDNLTINQKFMFTKVLFYGDFESFSRAIDELDKLQSMDDALRYLEKQSASWDRESREFHEFMEMVEKRFS